MTAIAKKENNVVEMNTPYALIESAVANNASVDTLERLMGLQERHEANQARKAFFEAMQKFQSIKPDLVKRSEVKFNNTSYKFCSLADIEKALKQPLSECGLSYRFENSESDGSFGVTCIVSHVQGHSERTTMKAPADDSGNKNKIQGIGSTSTYLMRYTLIAAFALTTADEDNDGQTNSDLPLQRVLQQNEALRDLETLKAVLGIKEALAEDNFYEVCELFYSMTDEQRNALWVAPSRGGIFTTEERAKIKSNEFVSVRADYFAAKEQ